MGTVSKILRQSRTAIPYPKRKNWLSVLFKRWPPTHRRKNVTQPSARELKIISDTVTKAPETSGKRKVPKFNVKNGKNQCLPGTKQQQKILTSHLEEKIGTKINTTKATKHKNKLKLTRG